MESPPSPRTLPARGLSGSLSLLAKAVASLGWNSSGRPERALHAMADLVRVSRAPEELRAALAQLAHRISGADRVELFGDPTPGPGSVRLACHPGPEPEPGPGRSGGAPRRPAYGPVPLDIPLRVGGRVRGRLRLFPGRRPWDARAVRVLTTLATLAAVAEQALAATGPAAVAEPVRDPVTRLHNAAFLAPFLEHALEMARRRGEPLSALIVAADRLGPARERHGPRIADAALQAMARAVSATLRSSDVVARLGADRLAAVLPGATAADAPAIAESVRRAAAEAGLTSSIQPPPTASVGFATFPDQARDPQSLLDAAAASLDHAPRPRGRAARAIKT